MRLALKHQIILAPATVLLLMALILGFLQYTYWDLSLRRQEANNLKTAFIAVAEADLAAQRMYSLAVHFNDSGTLNVQALEEMSDLYGHLNGAVERIFSTMSIPAADRALLRQKVADLNPAQRFDSQRIIAAIGLLRPQLATLSGVTQKQREQVRDVHTQDMDQLVAQTTFISIVVLGTAILLGVFLSLAFARHILRRIQLLSDSAGRIVRGDLTPPPAPLKVADELDDLALSINHMADRLIRVVSTEKLLEGAEEERRRIAMDIHDQTLCDLSSVLRGLQDIQGCAPCREHAAILEEDMRRAIGNLRDVMDNLHPQTLDILGLGAALQSHLERQRAGEGLPDFHCYISSEADATSLPRLARLSLYRIALEAIHNVVKHARAGRFEVVLDRRNDALILSVEDNGQGFNATQTLGGGRGLTNMRERARSIGAVVSWGPSRFSSGCRFELVLPLSTPGSEG